MPKRKNSDDFKYLKDKLKKLEREVYSSSSRRKRVRVMQIASSSSSSSSPEPSPSRRPIRRSEPQDRQTDTAHNSQKRNHESDGDLVAALYGQVASPTQPRAPSPPPLSAPTAQQTVTSIGGAAPACAPTVSTALVHAPATVAARASATKAIQAQAQPGSSSRVEQPNELEPFVEGDTENALDDDLMEILGIDPTQTNNFGPEIHKEVAIRFEHCSTAGLKKEIRKELSEKYLIPSNCKLINAPVLNPEVRAALTEPVVKRDKAIETKQKLLAAAISSLSQGITSLLSLNEKHPDILRLVIDTGRMLCDCQHNDSLTRRNYVLSSVKNEMKEQMKNAKIDNLLFGENLQETLKAAKAINKSGADLKAANSFMKSKANSKPAPTSSKNWRTSGRKQTAVSRAKETTTSAVTRNPRASSSKKSQPQPRSSRR